MYDDWSLMEFVKLGENIPEVSCVYFLFNEIELVYIGETMNLRKRVATHNYTFNSNIIVGGKAIVPAIFDCMYYVKVENDKRKRLEVEKKYILDYKPKLNYSCLFRHEMFPRGFSYVEIYDYYSRLGLLENQQLLTNEEKEDIKFYTDGWL